MTNRENREKSSPKVLHQFPHPFSGGPNYERMASRQAAVTSWGCLSTILFFAGPVVGGLVFKATAIDWLSVVLLILFWLASGIMSFRTWLWTHSHDER